MPSAPVARRGEGMFVGSQHCPTPLLGLVGFLRTKRLRATHGQQDIFPQNKICVEE